MNKKTIRLAALLLAALSFCVCTVGTVMAISVGDAVEPIDTGRKCSLSLIYKIGGTAMAGLNIDIYQAATVTAHFDYQMCGAFSSYPIDMNAVRAQSEWDVITDTLAAYITADHIAPTASRTTNTDGAVSFTDLAPGMYYVRWRENPDGESPLGFAPFMVAVPGLGSDGRWIYDVTAIPKPGELPPTPPPTPPTPPDEPEPPKPVTITVVKLWQDEGLENTRPAEVHVSIYRNGEPFEDVILSEEDGWTYSWQTDRTYQWTAVERDVAEGYKVAINNQNTVIQITNAKKKTPPEPPVPPDTPDVPDEPTPPEPPVTPPTGDSFTFYLWAMGMSLSGIVLIALGIRMRKNRDA